MPDIHPDAPSVNLTTGKQTSPHLCWPPMLADHPLFKAGFVIGMRRSAASSTIGNATLSQNAEGNLPPEEAQ